MNIALRWAIAGVGWLVLLIVYGVWKDVERHTGGGFITGSLRGIIVFGGAYYLYKWVKKDIRQTKQENIENATSQAFVPTPIAPSQTPPNTVITNYDEAYSLIPLTTTAKEPTHAPISAPVGSTTLEQVTSGLMSSSVVQPQIAMLNTALPEPNNAVSQEILPMEGIEDVIYEQIGAELEENATDKGVWTKAYAITGGDQTETRVVYIKLRFEKLLRIEQSKLALKKNQEQQTCLEIEHHRQQKEQERRQQSSLTPHEKSATPDIKSHSLSGDSEATRFLNLIRYGQTEKVLQMLRINPSLVSAQNNSALLIAVLENHVPLARELVEAGAKFSPNDFTSARIKEFLEKNKIDVNQ